MYSSLKNLTHKSIGCHNFTNLSYDFNQRLKRRLQIIRVRWLSKLKPLSTLPFGAVPVPARPSVQWRKQIFQTTENSGNRNEKLKHLLERMSVMAGLNGEGHDPAIRRALRFRGPGTRGDICVEFDGRWRRKGSQIARVGQCTSAGRAASRTRPFAVSTRGSERCDSAVRPLGFSRATDSADWIARRAPSDPRVRSPRNHRLAYALQAIWKHIYEELCWRHFRTILRVRKSNECNWIVKSWSSIENTWNDSNSKMACCPIYWANFYSISY